jgi:hypothetical protein
MRGAAMSVDVSDGPAIVAGYAYRLQVEAEIPVFPDGCALTAHVRSKVGDSAIIATLTTANGGLTRLSDTVIEIAIPPEPTEALRAGTVVMDVVRTDVDPDLHLNFTLEIPVVRPVTRGLA